MAWLPAMPPVIKFVSKLVNKVHVQVLHKPGADLGGWMGSLSKISLASSLRVSEVTQICGLCLLPQAAQITPPCALMCSSRAHELICGARLWDYFSLC